MVAVVPWEPWEQILVEVTFRKNAIPENQTVLQCGNDGSRSLVVIPYVSASNTPQKKRRLGPPTGSIVLDVMGLVQDTEYEPMQHSDENPWESIRSTYRSHQLEPLTCATNS